MPLFFAKEDIAEILDIALELRRRVKEQLKKLNKLRVLARNAEIA